MPAAHRQDDLRACGATTIVVGQSNVYVEGKLWSVVGDPNTDGNGQLISAVGSTVFINGKLVIVIGDSASPDDLCIPLGGLHCAPIPTTGSSTVFCY
jgi:uncharacterized Zn-binding protein involved in type VI secretion